MALRTQLFLFLSHPGLYDHRQRELKSTYTYDGKRLSGEQSSDYSRSFSYDGEGNLIHVTQTDWANSGTSGTWEFQYAWEPGTHRMTGLTRSYNGTVQYGASIEYDRLGRFTRICKNGSTSCPTYAYLGENDWLSAMSSSAATITDRYFYADGRPLRLDTGGTSYYYRYNARRDVAATVRTNGDGPQGWTVYGCPGRKPGLRSDATGTLADHTFLQLS